MLPLHSYRAATHAASGARPSPVMLAGSLPSDIPTAQDCTQARTNKADDPARELSTLVTGLLERTFSGLITRLFVEAIPLPEATSFYRSAQQALRAICETDASVQTKVRDVAAVLRTLDRSLDTEAVRASTPMRALKSYLQAVLPWLHEVDAQWCDFTMMADAWSSQTRWTAQALDLLGAIDRLCTRPALREVVQQPGVAQALGHVRDLQQLLAKVDLLQSLPAEASLNDYIGIVAGGAAWPGRFGEVLQPIVLALSAVCAERPCPVHAGLGDQIAWLMGVLTDPLARARVQPHLEMMLGGPEAARQLSAVMQVSQSLARYPSESSAVGQARWLVEQVLSSGVMAAFDRSSLAWAGPLVADRQVMAVFDAMLDTTHHAQSWPALMASLGRAALLEAGPWAAHRVANMAKGYALQAGAGHAMQWLSGHVMPREVRAEIEAFYQASSATESWSDMLARVSACVYRLAKPQVVQHLLAEPTAAATVRYADLLQAHTDWKQTMAWFIAQDTSEDALLGPLYGHFTTVLISWKVYEALGVEDVEQAESALRRLTRELKDMQLVRTYPQLGKLLDLLPLLPALRQVRDQIRAMEASHATPDAHVSGPTWWDRAARWQHALLQMDTPATQVAADRLSRCLESWLVDAGMLACQYLAQAAALPVPGAAAAPMSAGTSADARNLSGQDTASRIGSEASRQTRPEESHATRRAARIDTAPAPLAAGVTLGVLGAASLLYGVWQCTRGTPAYASVSAQADALPDASSSGLTDGLVDGPTDGLTDRLADRLADGLAVRTPVSPTWRAMPFVVSVASLTAAGCLVYPYLRDWWASAAPAESRNSDWLDAATLAEMQRAEPALAQAIAALQLPQWGSIVEEVGAPSRAASGVRPKAKRDTAVETAPSKQLHETVQAWLRHILNHSNLDPRTKVQMSMLIERCYQSSYFQSASNWVEQQARMLIKLMQSVLELSHDEKYIEEDDRNLHGLKQMWSALMPEYHSLSYKAYGKIIQDFGKLFLIDGRLITGPTQPVETPVILPTLTDHAQTEAESLIKSLYSPVLDPVLCIDQFVRDGIAKYQERTGKGGGLNPHSRLRITLHPVWTGETNYIASEYTARIGHYAIRDIVTGQHIYAISTIKSIYPYRIVSIEQQELIDELRKTDLQALMMAKFEAYRADTNKVRSYQSFVHSMIIQRCVTYLQRKDNFPLFARSVSEFLQNEGSATLLLFRDQVVNGAFCIPVHGHKMALILSIDEPVCFHVFEFKHTYSAPYPRTMVLPDFPASKQFEDWLYTKIPVRHAMRYPDRQDAIVNKYGDIDVIRHIHVRTRFKNVLISAPLTFSARVQRSELPELLTNHSFDRVASDIDTLVLTEGEQTGIVLLESFKFALNYLSAIATVALPGTGTLLSIACAFLGGIVATAAEVSASLLQAHIADRPDEIDEYTLEAIIGAAVGAVCALPEMKQFGQLVANRALSPARVQQAIAVYRKMQAQIRGKYGATANAGRASAPPVPGHRHTTALVAETGAPVVPGKRPQATEDAYVPVDEVLSPPNQPGATNAGGSKGNCLGRWRKEPIVQYHYMKSDNFLPLPVSRIPGKERVGYRTLPDSDYVHIYTLPDEGEPIQSSSTLVVSAHGGFHDRDLLKPAIPMPPRMTLDLLCPHGTSMYDPSLDRIINDRRFEAYVSISRHFTKVHFIPQTHSEWFFGPGFDPYDVANTHGPLEGLPNYFHTQYPDPPEDIAQALLRNRDLAASGEVQRADIMVVNNDTRWVEDLNAPPASLKTLLDMDRDGKLLNAAGKRYERIVCSHCRSNVDHPEKESTYDAVDHTLSNIERRSPVRWKRAIYKTIITPQRDGREQKIDEELVALYLYRNELPVATVAEDAIDDTPTAPLAAHGSRETERVMSFYESGDRW